MNEPFDFGVRLRKLRESKNLSQGDVAKRLNVTNSAISGYENNTSSPSLEMLTNLAILFNVSTDYLLNLEKRQSLYLDGFSEMDKISALKILDILRDNLSTKE